MGFNAEKSHRIVDMDQCHILRPELFSLVGPLRRLLDPLLRQGQSAELQLSLVDQGLDLLIRNVEASGVYELELLTSFSKATGLARLSLDDGFGSQTIYEPERATVTLSQTVVAFPVGAFLQATSDGEKVLIDCVRETVRGSTAIADLFAGLGTFALGVGARYAAEASRDSALALANAAPRSHVEHRDLYRRPLGPDELKAFDCVILDPPRAGAEAQVRMLARSELSKIAYVSCNPATFARDFENPD